MVSTMKGTTMKSKLIIAARILLGLIFFVFGLNFFLHFLPQPPLAGPAGAFAGAMFATGYLFVLVKVVEVTCGLLLLAGRFVPLALTLLAPIVVNIVFFHAFLAPSGIALPLVVLALELFLAWSYRNVYRPMLAVRAVPST
jgi:uncharacterized membrane protein YphA (DoxX/SURF4 family)